MVGVAEGVGVWVGVGVGVIVGVGLGGIGEGEGLSVLPLPHAVMFMIEMSEKAILKDLFIVGTFDKLIIAFVKLTVQKISCRRLFSEIRRDVACYVPTHQLENPGDLVDAFPNRTEIFL